MPCTLEVLRISTVVDIHRSSDGVPSLEVLRISTVVDDVNPAYLAGFGSAKNFYCCRWAKLEIVKGDFGSAKNFYCCRYLCLTLWYYLWKC